jgi:hypothetical protein
VPTFSCAACAHSFKVRAAAHGRLARCPGCGQLARAWRDDDTGDADRQPARAARTAAVPSTLQVALVAAGGALAMLIAVALAVVLVLLLRPSAPPGPQGPQQGNAARDGDGKAGPDPDGTDYRLPVEGKSKTYTLTDGGGTVNYADVCRVKVRRTRVEGLVGIEEWAESQAVLRIRLDIRDKPGWTSWSGRPLMQRRVPPSLRDEAGLAFAPALTDVLYLDDGPGRGVYFDPANLGRGQWLLLTVPDYVDDRGKTDAPPVGQVTFKIPQRIVGR